MFINQVTVVGNLTRDPELKTLPSGIKVANMSIATNRVWSNDAGEKQEAVEYHNIVVFGRQAETSAQYLTKGQKCGVVGRLQTQNWEDKDSGKKMYRTEIIASLIQFGSRAGGGSDQPKGDYSNTPEAQGDWGAYDDDQTVTETEDEYAAPDDDGDINPEDIPF